MQGGLRCEQFIVLVRLHCEGDGGEGDPMGRVRKAAITVFTVGIALLENAPLCGTMSQSVDGNGECILCRHPEQTYRSVN